MGVPVQAPTELVWEYGNGRMVVAPRTSMNPNSPLFNVPDLSRQGTFRTFETLDTTASVGLNSPSIKALNAGKPELKLKFPGVPKP